MWKNAKGVVKPLDAPMAGYENENAVFIARTNFKDGVHPCKFVENFGCYVSYGGKEYSVTDFEYYTGSVKWVKCTNHQIPDGAIVAGHESDGKKLYIGRTEYQNMLITGKQCQQLKRYWHLPRIKKSNKISKKMMYKSELKVCAKSELTK